MKTIAHISDLHFGREDPTVASGLIRDLHDLKPTLIVNSGDLTQRARTRQFRSAATFLDRLPRPQITVPGNHDIPLYDVIRRFLSPLSRFRRYISEDRFPLYVDDEIAVLGINTARSATWKGGRISFSQIREIERAFAALPSDLFKVLVTHHPFIPPPGDELAGIDLVGRAKQTLEMIARREIDLLLAGHLHHGYTGDVRTFYPTARRSVIVAQAGTAISHRVRNEPNGYNVIHLSKDRIVIAVRRWNGGSFESCSKTTYTFQAGAWTDRVES